MQQVHPIHRRYWAEDLVRLRRADERQRYAASQRRGRIDPNPHQIDAVIFALRRLREGGCILADEVGLGKTIEAGLVIAQLLAEGARRVLIVVPKPLMGQWQNELYTLFGVETREGEPNVESFIGNGVFIVGREFAGNDKGAGLLRTAEPFDLCVIDEAHEIFAGIHKRYARDGSYRTDSTEARMADRVKSFLGATPVLLLTATPIQNSLAELWGLVQYVEPTGTLLGSLATFREVFCEPGSNDRVLVAEQARELRRRVNTVCQRTLRRQAQEFLERPFTKRRALLFEYSMSAEEKALYDDVTAYLMEPTLCAFSGSQRRLLLISFHRLMASSHRAFAKSLEKVMQRLHGLLASASESPSDAIDDFSADLEDEELPVEDDEQQVIHDPDRIRAELARVEAFVERAKSLNSDAKAQRLRDAVRLVRERGQRGDGSGKVVIFTESLTTQNYIRELLLEDGLGLSDEDITLFRGTNDSARDNMALEAWRADVETHIPPPNRPSRQVAIRLALVHEFRTRSTVFISTEAGAKGLNLQFCDTIINYDLPWNPQRIEQRIGRCHRYSQERDVTVVNFLARDNEAQRLTFQILSEKLDLFGQVLDASDVVLHEPASAAPETLATALGTDFESQLRRIYERARSQDELSDELRRLSDTMDEQRKRFEETQERMEGLIESRFDDSVRQVFHRIAEELPASLAELDTGIDRVVSSYLDSLAVDYCRREDAEGRIVYEIPSSDSLPDSLQDGVMVAVGHTKGLEDVDPLHLSHPLLVAAVEHARVSSRQPFTVAFRSSADDPQLSKFHGRRGRLVVTRVKYQGFEPVERLLLTALAEGEADPIDAELALRLLWLPVRDVNERITAAVSEDDLRDAIEEGVFVDQTKAARAEQARFEQLMDQIERYVDDQTLVLRRNLAELEVQARLAEQKRDSAMGPEARQRTEKRLMKIESQINELEERIRQLETREDEDYLRWRDQAHRRRYVAPTTEQILDVEFVIE